MAGRLLVVVTSSDAEKVLEAMLIAANAREMGYETYLYFTLNGVEALVRGQINRLKPSKGTISSNLRRRADRLGLPSSLEDFYDELRSAGVRVLVDEPSLLAAGLTRGDLLPVDGLAGPGLPAAVAGEGGGVIVL
ncbi:MAG: DsrE/DsrF/DrsH-like family protein [Desulfurococcales archaeon]|nr:DsrE/DsrF/DrsH-like family protein [Desulfurococcales archaeon]